MPGPIDLHAHSSVSDGTETPAELVAAGVAAGLGVLAITDHDSTAGWDQAFIAADGTGLEIVPGIELSTQLDYASVHILGYLVDPTDAALVEATAAIRSERLHRAEAMVERIAADYALDWEDVLAQTTPGATVGRPHIADALVARGHVPDRSAAFATILHWRGGYYRPHEAPPPLEGVRLIAGAGGVPVIAHPGARGPERVLSDARMRALVDAGLFGLELDHRDNPASGRAHWAEVARRFGLVTTGSSDYHGAGKPNRLAENTTDPEVYAAIVARGTGARPFRTP
ncbi:PHP domain-containing protein [Protaetiibacter intestinalis]|uniref:PHP domain-containing protein n=1 Tax=Protaetiibacter intestinalis TaxID=2419774 RepID=A0A387B3U2_9MICO|nr:PHP domain-containing protein [Protaetiibacter intestinalis]AYF97083.1 PHP domain-containing protein [Protaetiibacter intestinalis]